MFLNGLENCWMVLKPYVWFEKFPGGLKSFQVVRKISRRFGNFLMVWKVAGWLENFWMAGTEVKFVTAVTAGDSVKFLPAV